MVNYASNINFDNFPAKLAVGIYSHSGRMVTARAFDKKQYLLPKTL